MNKRAFNALRKVARGVNSELGGAPSSELDRRDIPTEAGRFVGDNINHMITQNQIDELRNRFGENYSQYLPIFDKNNPEGAKRAYRALLRSGYSGGALRDLYGGAQRVKPSKPALDYFRSTPAESKLPVPAPGPAPAPAQ